MIRWRNCLGLDIEKFLNQEQLLDIRCLRLREPIERRLRDAGISVLFDLTSAYSRAEIAAIPGIGRNKIVEIEAALASRAKNLDDHAIEGIILELRMRLDGITPLDLICDEVA